MPRKQKGGDAYYDDDYNASQQTESYDLESNSIQGSYMDNYDDMSIRSGYSYGSEKSGGYNYDKSADYNASKASSKYDYNASTGSNYNANYNSDYKGAYGGSVKGDYTPDGNYDYGERDIQNSAYIFDSKGTYNIDESDYDYSGQAGAQFRNVKSSKIPLDAKLKKSKSKTLCKSKNAAKFFQKRQQNHKIIVAEHEALQKVGVAHPATCGSHSLNDLKNRFAAAIPYDYNRVRLLDILYEAESDYINASYVNSFDRKCSFIATQNPLEHTVKEFWAMVYENRCKAIFALVDYDNKKNPLERYWPPEGTVLEYEEFEVHALKKSKLGTIIVRDFEIIPANNLTSLRVRHYNYGEWSDMRAPPIMSDIGLLVKNAREFIANESGGPIVVHCSSGTGRTGVFLAVVLISDQMELLGMFDVYRTAAFLKEQRRLLFKDLPAYLFINIYAAKLVSLQAAPTNESLYSL